jgi:hypothetical protein
MQQSTLKPAINVDHDGKFTTMEFLGVLFLFTTAVTIGTICGNVITFAMITWLRGAG